MRTSQTILRLALALALLLFGMPLGALEAPAVAGDQAGEAAGPSWFSSGLETPAAPETGASREAPESSTVVAPGGAATVDGRDSEHVAAAEAAALGAPTPLYLSHCAFLC